LRISKVTTVNYRIFVTLTIVFIYWKCCNLRISLNI